MGLTIALLLMLGYERYTEGDLLRAGIHVLVVTWLLAREINQAQYPEEHGVGLEETP